MKKKNIYLSAVIVTICLCIISVILASNSCCKDSKYKLPENKGETITDDVTTKEITIDFNSEEIYDEEKTVGETTTDEVTTEVITEITTVENITTKKLEENTTEKITSTTSKVEETTKQPETTTKKEVMYDLSEDNRIKNCELQLISRLREFDRWDDNIGDYVPATMYDFIKEKKYNPYLQTLDFGWENILVNGVAGLRYPETEEDDFSAKHPNDTWATTTERDVQWSKKYYDAIIKDCENWVKNENKTSAKAFQDYLVSKYTYDGANSIFENSVNPDGYTNDEYMGRTKEFCEQWCYYDNTDKQYKVTFNEIKDFAVYTYEKKGYFDNVSEMIKWVQFTGDGTYDETYGYGCKYFTNTYSFVRWTYDKNADKTIIYMVFAR